MTMRRYRATARVWVRTLSRAFVVVAVHAWLIAFAPTAAAVDAPENYRLASGDAIRVLVFQNPEMTLETRVSEDGSITYPLIGKVELGNLALGAAESRIAQALQDGGFLKQPQVTVQLVAIKGNRIAVLGHVNKPGAYPLQTFDTRLSQALAEAGGLDASGDDRVILTGTRNGNAFRRVIDIDRMYRSDAASDDERLAGGDTIYVPRAPMFYIYGQVTRPGNYRVDRNMTMRQALAAGGGLTLRGTENRLRVVRRNAGGVPEKQTAELNDLVAPDDVIYVSESLF